MSLSNLEPKQGLKRKTSFLEIKSQKKTIDDDFWSTPAKKIFELIFQHFSHADVVNVSRVSKAFYSITGSSAACMTKIVFNVGKNESSLIDFKTSARQYENLKLHNFSEEICQHLSKHSWKRISLLIGSISGADCLKLLHVFTPTAREFEFYIENVVSQNVMAPIAFPEVDTLTFRWTSKRMFEPFTSSLNTNLKTVIIELTKCGCNRAVEEFLRHNKSILNLSIRMSSEDFNEFFTHNTSEGFEFNLQTLSFYWRLTKFVEPEIIDNWKSFLLSQKNSLTRLVFECTFDCKEVLEMIVNEMHVLQHLTFVDLDDEALLTSEKLDFVLKPNLSITQLDVCVNWFISDGMFEELILALPNLEILYVVELSTRVMKYLAKNTKNLRLLIYEEISTNCEDSYEDMVSYEENINKNIEIHWDQDFEVLYPKLHEKMQFS